MVWPVVAVAAATAAAQYYQSEKARGASEKRLKELEADFKRLVPPQYDVSIMDPPEYIKSSIPEPTFDMGGVTPEQYKLVAKYTPKLAQLVTEQRPELAQETAGAKEGRQAQLDAMRRLKAISLQESDPELAQQLSNANQQSQIQAQSRQASVLQDAARRGMLGSGMTLAAQLQGSSDAMGRAAMQSQAAAAEAYKNRLAALRDSASLGGQIRSEDMSQENRNADIINDFNARTSKNRQAWENQRAGVMNDAEIRNLGEEQRVSDSNIDTRNKYSVAQQDRRDTLLKYLDQRRQGERGYQNDVMQRQAEWKRGERDNQNTLKSRQYGDEMQRLAGKNGIASQYNSLDMQKAQDRNQAIQGLGNAAAGAYSSYAQGQDQTAMQDRADRRSYFEKYGYWDENERKKAGGMQ